MSNRLNSLIKNKTILQSNTSGPFIIIKDLGKVNGRNRVIIKFINTGCEKDVLLNNALAHRVKDSSINYVSKDFDYTRIDNYDKYIDELLKQIYRHMIDRCYNKDSKKYISYGNKGIKISNEWLNDINTFINDCKLLYGFDKFYIMPHLYQLDKDYLQMNIPKNERIYSKDTCIFIYYQDNTNLKIIENNINNDLYGIEINSAGNYYTRIKINGSRINIGTFNNKIAAANAYNYWQLYFHNFELVPLINDVPFMPPNEFIKYNIRPKTMCKYNNDN